MVRRLYGGGLARPAGTRGVTVRVLKACPVRRSAGLCVPPTQVVAILQRGDVRTFCKARGYPPAMLNRCWHSSPSSFAVEEDFPHEIGVSWATRWQMSSASFRIAAKLYGLRLLEGYTDPAAAQKAFDRYKSASESTPAVITTAPPIRQLTVAA